MSPEQLQAISQKSCSVLRNFGPEIQWVESYVTDNKIYCVYIAPNEEMIRMHARISEVRAIIDPTTAESPKQIIGPVQLLAQCHSGKSRFPRKDSHTAGCFESFGGKNEGFIDLASSNGHS
jgi:hypothetical protein